jgi:UDP-N-acetylglucosamine 3-dehydrogenase
MSELRVGIIGCGGIAQAAHLPHWDAHEGAKLVAVADVNEEAAKSTAEQYGAEAFYTDFNELVERDDLDIVDVTTPPKWHAPAAIAALEAGKHVLVEKPMARTVAECDAMIAAAKKAGVLLMVTHHDRMGPMNQKIKQLLDAGLIGKPYEIANVGGMYHMVGAGWFYDKEIAGGGAGMDGVIYTSYTWQYWMGPVKSVYALTDTFEKNHPVFDWWGDGEWDVTVTSTPDTTVEDSLAMMLRFESGAVGVLYCSWVSPTGHERQEILGSDGLIELTGPDAPRIFLKDDKGEYKKGWNAITASEEGNVYFDRIAHFVDCIQNGTTPITTGEEGRDAVQLIEAAYRSAAEGKPIELPL